MKKALYEWEYELHQKRTRNQRKRSKAQKALAISIAAWAALVAALMLTAARPATEQGDDYPTVPENAPEPQEMAIAEVEEEPSLDLSKFPMIENATLTHYCICEKCCGKADDHPAYGITASGRAAEPYVSVAVDTALIELGSTVYIDYGDGVIHEYRADDTGSGVAGTHIDLCVSNHEEALELGIKTVKVWWDE